VADAGKVESQKGLFGTPKGFPTVFITELCERFSYYGMKAILLYYIIGAVGGANHGLGLERQTGITIVALYGALIYLSTILGGWLSDRVFGQTRMITVGGFFIMCGHIVLALPFGIGGMFVSLALLIIGTGLLKPNVSALVGRLYDSPQYENKRDAGFSIFYMGVNLGAVIATILVGTIGQKVNYHIGFSIAAIVMAIGLFVFIVFFGRRFSYLDTGAPNPLRSNEKRRVGIIAGIIVLVILITVGIVMYDPQFGEHFAKTLVLAVTIALVFFCFINMLSSKEITPQERKNVTIYIPLFLAGVLLWIIQESGGNILAEFVMRANNQIGGFVISESWYQSINPIIVISGCSFFAFLWTKLGPRQPSIVAKLCIGLALLSVSYLMLVPIAKMGTGFSPFFVVLSYVLTASGEVFISPLLLSVTTLLAPRKYTSQLMAVWYLSNAVAQSINAQTAGWYISHPMSYFSVIGILPCIFLFVLLLMRKKIIAQIDLSRPALKIN
jgi:POT family proton-dependent oligopeptide transporter